MIEVSKILDEMRRSPLMSCFACLRLEFAESFGLFCWSLRATSVFGRQRSNGSDLEKDGKSDEGNLKSAYYERSESHPILQLTTITFLAMCT